MPIKLSRIRQLMQRLVVVDKVAELRAIPPYSGDRAYIPKDVKPRAGWVVGVRWLRAGAVTWQGPERFYEFTGPAVPHLLVSFWPSQRPVTVPMDGWRLRKIDMKVCGKVVLGGDPLPWDGQWDEAARAEMAADAGGLARDERGRFV